MSRRVLLLLGLLVLILVPVAATGCGGDDDDGGEEAATDAGETEATGGGASGSISVMAVWTGPEQEAFQAVIDGFTEQNPDVDVSYTSAGDQLPTQLSTAVEGGNPPDVAVLPQPGLMRDFAEQEALVSLDFAAADIEENFGESVIDLGTVDGTLYATPLGANVKSFVWYSPQEFADKGYEIPTTWDELMTLSQTIADSGSIPWCAGIESGTATGWPATDWLEDVVLRTAGPDVYDQWVNHTIPFNDPQIVEALATVGDILRNPAYVNGGLGDVSSIATAPWNESGNPILDGNCTLHRAANFYQANWAEDVKVQEEPVENGVFAFYLPGVTAEDKPLLGGGEFVTAFSDRPEVAAFQAYLSSPEWANEKAKVTGQGWISANSGLDPELLQSPIDILSYELLTDETYTFRFDGSDQMPGAVGAGSFWTEMTDWIATGQSDEETLTAIEDSWPTS